ncbi:MAG TPA: hypothetical protein VHE61_14595 [Opitutaceae bacterium]|nr:hypothetical protein [Opitutaceae bacterium]
MAVQVQAGMMMEGQQSFAHDRAIALAPLAARMLTIREMLANLDTLTIAGQQHLMNRVAAFIEGQVTEVPRGAGGANRRMLTEQLELLKHESGRPLPSVSAFRRRADNLLDLLNAGG